VRGGALSPHGWYFDFTFGVPMADEGPHGPFRQVGATGDTPAPAIGLTG